MNLKNKEIFLLANKVLRKDFCQAFVSFGMTLILCSLLIGIIVYNRVIVERLRMEQMIIEKSSKAKDVISNLLYKTQTLAVLVLNNNGEIENFEQVAETIVDDSNIKNILVAPQGIVTHVYPLTGNESVLGLNFFEEGVGNKEALLAKETGRLVLGGPFNLIQGGQALVGRLPVFINTQDGDKSFWGLIAIALKYPEVLEKTGLNELHMQGFAYEIWRINPDNNEKQIIVSSDYDYNDKYTHYIEKHISIINADWYFRILPVKSWYEYYETWIAVVISLFISFLVALVIWNNNELKILKSKYENMSQMDSLTNIFNRRHFMELALMLVERTVRVKTTSFIVIFDVDHFKKINDLYGHLIGDDVLKYIVKRVKSTLRPYDLFARYGGEEFIMLFTDLDEIDVLKLVERVRMKICELPIEVDNVLIPVSASFGIAPVTPVNNLDEAVSIADKALYFAKEKGRNRVIFFNDLKSSELKF